MVALLKKVEPGQDAAMVLGQAVREFIRREFGERPEWVAVGAGVDLPAGSAGRFELRRIGNNCPSGHIQVGRGEKESDEG